MPEIIAPLRQMRESLKATITNSQRELAKVEKAIAMFSNGAERATKVTRPTKMMRRKLDGRPSARIAAAIEELKTSGQPMPASALFERLAAKGIKIPSPDHLSSSLYATKKVINIKGRGWWPADAPRPKKGKAA